MSADNGIYILKNNDGYRVTHAQAIDNLYWWRVEGGSIDQYEQRNEINPSVLFSYFKNSEVYKDKNEAWHQAVILYRQQEIVEYGISFIEGFEEKDFPTQCCTTPKILVDGDGTIIARCYNCGEYL